MPWGEIKYTNFGHYFDEFTHLKIFKLTFISLVVYTNNYLIIMLRQIILSGIMQNVSQTNSISSFFSNTHNNISYNKNITASISHFASIIVNTMRIVFF